MNHEFVEFIPEQLDEGVIYVSFEHRTAIHKCCCGCKNEVVTPFSPTDWNIKFNGESISLSPSIGNWNFPCRSHYWIKNNQVEWASNWSDDAIKSGRRKDSIAKNKYFNEHKSTETVLSNDNQVSPHLWGRLRLWLSKLFH